MNAKDLIIDFINYVFVLLLIIFCIFYFLAGQHFANFISILRSLAIIAIFSIFLLIKINFNRKNRRLLEKEGEIDQVFYLTYFDKFKSDIVIFLLPITIIFVAFIINLTIGIDDILQAILAFLIMYLWQKIIFKKK